MSEAKTSNLRKYISAVVRICVAVVAVYFVFRNQDLGNISKKLSEMNLFVFLGACFLHLFCHGVAVFRWRLLLGIQDISISYFAALKLHLLGLFYNSFMPGAVGGDILKAWYATHHTDKKVEAALSVFVDRAIGLGCTVLMGGFCYWLILREGGGGFEMSHKASDSSVLSSLLPVVAVCFGILIILTGVLSLIRNGRVLLVKIWRFVLEKGLKLAKKLLTAGKLYCSKPLTLLFAMFLTFFLQGMAITAIWLVCRNLDIAVNIKYFLIFFPISWMIGALPISVGGLGIMEKGLDEMFKVVPSMVRDDAVIPGLVQRAIWLVTSIPGLIIQLKGAHLPADKAEFLVDSGGELD